MSFKSQFAGLGRFFKPYYILNSLSMLTYLYTRDLVYSVANNQGADMINHWEKNVFTTLAVLLTVKLIRCQSLDAFASDFLMFTKSSILFMTWIIDKRIFAWYFIMFSLLFMMMTQPFYEGPEDMEYYTPATFDDIVKRCKDPEKRFLVEFYTSWSPPCVHLEPIFSQLSVEFGSERLQFGKLDLGRWPLAAKQFNIDISGTSKQLPTLIMFEGGAETGRIPHVYSDGKVAKGRYRRADIIKACELGGKKKKPRPSPKPKSRDQKKKE